MWHMVNNIRSLLFPSRKTAAFLKTLTEETVTISYAPRERGAVTVLSQYTDEVIRACVIECKFHNCEKSAELLASLLARWLGDTKCHYDVVVPIPLTRKRYRKRGYNQVIRIIDAYNKHTHAPLQRVHALFKQRHTPPQTTLKREERKKNVVDSFAIRRLPRKHITGARVLLLDDVSTTGATLKEARRELAIAKPKSIMCVAIAG